VKVPWVTFWVSFKNFLQISHYTYSVLNEKFTQRNENASLFLVLSLHPFLCQLCFVLLAGTAEQEIEMEDW